MKRLWTLAVATMMATMTMSAQNSELENEIGISYGAGLSLIGDGIGNALGRGLIEVGSGAYKWDNEKNFGSLAVEYFRHLNNPRLAVGGIAAFALSGEDVVRRSDDVKAGDRTRTYFTLMPAVKYSWVNNDHFAFYSKLAVGGTLMNEKGNNDKENITENDSKLYLAFQVSALGIEFGGKLRGFLELGVGEQGIALAGLKYKF